MATDKKISYEMQGNVRNYLGKQKMVRAPLHWQSGPGHPKTQLAYITKPELDLILKKDFHGSLKDGPNVGPSGIMSLNDPATGRSGSEVSAAETGGSGHGMSASEAAGYRSGFVAAGGRGTKAEMKAAKKEYGSRYRGQDRRSGLGGLLGGIGRGLLGFFGGIPGKIMSGILSARNLANRTGTKIGEFGETDEEGNPKYPTWDRYINRNTDKYKDKPYRGQGKGYDMTDWKNREANNLELYTNRVNEPIGPGKRVGQDHGRYGMGSQYDQTRMPSNITSNMGANNFNNTAPNNELFTDNNLMAFNPGSLLDQKINQAYNTYNETGFGQNNLEELMKMDIQNQEDTGNPLSLPNSAYTMFGAEGGRVGYNRGRVVNPGGYQGEEEEVDSVKHAIMLEQIDKLEKMIASGLDSDGRLQARLDQLNATPTTGLGTGPDLVPPDDMAQGGIARLL